MLGIPEIDRKISLRQGEGEQGQSFLIVEYAKFLTYLK